MDDLLKKGIVGIGVAGSLLLGADLIIENTPRVEMEILPTATKAQRQEYLQSNGKDIQDPAKIVKVCYRAGGLLQQGERFTSDGEVSFKSLRCVFPNRDEVIFSKTEKNDVFK